LRPFDGRPPGRFVALSSLGAALRPVRLLTGLALPQQGGTDHGGGVPAKDRTC